MGGGGRNKGMVGWREGRWEREWGSEVKTEGD